MHKSVESLGELISKRFDVELAERAWSAQAEEGEVELKSKTLVLSTKGIILRRNLSHPVFIKSSVRCTSRLGGAAIAGCSTLEMSFSALILILIFHSPFYYCATSVWCTEAPFTSRHSPPLRSYRLFVIATATSGLVTTFPINASSKQLVLPSW